MSPSYVADNFPLDDVRMGNVKRLYDSLNKILRMLSIMDEKILANESMLS